MGCQCQDPEHIRLEVVTSTYFAFASPVPIRHGCCLLLRKLIAMSIGCYIPQIRCKADLMKFCLESTAPKNEHGYIVGFNKKEALEMFRFFNRYVKLPDIDTAPEKELYDSVQQVLGGFAGSLGDMRVNR